MDIRSFFGSASTNKSSTSSEEGTKRKKHRKKTKKGVLFDSDSSDEDPFPSKVRKQLNSSIVIPDSGDESTKSKLKKSKLKKKPLIKAIKDEKINLKETTPSSFFGNFKPTVEKQRNQKRKCSNEDFEGKTKLAKKEKIDDFDDLEDVLPTVVQEIIKDKKSISSKIAKAAQEHHRVGKSKKHNSSNVEDKIKTEDKTVSNGNVKASSKTQSKGRETDKDKIKENTPPVQKVSHKPSDQQKSTTKSTPKKKTPEKKSPQDVSEPLSAKKEKFMKYQQWQNRSGPENPGSKEIPQGQKNCLEGLTFVITGVQESLTRDEIKSLVERYGGKVTGSVSGRTSYLITGKEAGESKLNKAAQLKTKVIDEDDFLGLIRTLKGKKSKYDVSDDPPRNTRTPKKETIKKEPSNSKPSPPKPKDIKVKKEFPSEVTSSRPSSQDSVGSLPASQKLVAGGDGDQLMWVDKYKPKSVKHIIGQQGPNSNLNKLLKWLRNWHHNHRTAAGKSKPKPKINQWGGGDPTGGSLKAALLSGPPGVGKTTTATLACQELGLSYVELNASDRRSKRSLKEDVGTSVQNTTISDIFAAKPSHSQTNHVMIMDEVDGMAGNEDRGGMQELIQLIKQTKIPIICMCNDRSSPKMRSLVNHCFDLRFQRPRVEQITGAVMSVCHKEGLKMEPPAVQAIIRGCNQDVRQVFHNLNMLKASGKSVSYDDAKSHAEKAQKDVNLGIFEIARKLLSGESQSLSIIEKSSLFFMDYSMIPKFVQENYLSINPFAAKGSAKKHLELMSKTADCLATSDLIDSSIRSGQNWSLLPTLGLMSTVLPTTYMCGGMGGMINFPAFFGKLSTTGKTHRLLQELKFHSSIVTGGTPEQTFNLDILTYLRWHLYRPLQVQTTSGTSEVHKVTQLLDDYDLTREDFDSIMEIGQFHGKVNPISNVDSKVKSAFTRLYNKESHMIPYAVLSAAAAKKIRKVATDNGDYDEEGSQVQDGSEEEEGMDVDGMIKESKKKPPAKPKPKAKKSSNDSAAGKKAKGRKK